MKRCKSLVAIPASLLTLAACSNMSGLGGSSDMTCAAPAGVPCQSVSGVYANAVAGTLPSQRPTGDRTPATPLPAGPGTTSVVAKPTASDADPAGAIGAIRSEPTVIRIWIAPWEDSDGDLHGDSYVYLQVDSGRWLIEHNRERIRQAFAPVPASASAPLPAPTTGAGPAARSHGQAPQPAAPRQPKPDPASARLTSLPPQDRKEKAP